MKKVAIVTITQNFNYGNRLQNYALQHFLEKMSMSVDTILDVYRCMYFPINFGNLYRSFGIKNIAKYILNYRDYRDYIKQEKLRYPAFSAFNKEYIRFSSMYVHYDKVPKDLESVYDFFIVGSDQVWNPLFKCTDLEFLTFAPREKRIAYAASFGISALPKQYQPRFRRWLDGMAYISVREAAGAEIVKSLTGRTAEVLVDPTLLLRGEEWRGVARKPAWFQEKPYLLTYFLGEPSPELRRKIEEIARENALDVIDLMDARQKEWFSIGPDAFLFLVERAKLVYTDSFHGTVFSILLHTPFVSCERVQAGMCDMTSRLDTLLEIFDMQSRRGTEKKGYFVDELFEMNFSGAEAVLERERQRSAAYLRRALQVEDEYEI